MDIEDLLAPLIPLIAVATLPAGILTFLFVGTVPGIAVFVVGWFLLLPVLAILAGLLSDDDDEPTPQRDPLEELRERYAAGELSDEEFEARVERLVATEDGPDDLTRVRREREAERE